MDDSGFDDVEALLKLCESKQIDPPKVTMTVARSFSQRVLDRFLESPLPEVRIMVVQALWERHHEKNTYPPILDKLNEDKVEVVAVAARNLIMKLTDGKGPVAKVTIQAPPSGLTRSLSDKGKGKDKGK